MLQKIENTLIIYLKDNFFIFAVITAVFILGIVVGSISIKTLNDLQKDNLANYINLFFQRVDIDSIDGNIILKHTILNNIKYVSIIWILGLTIIGVPFIMFLIFIRGFTIGFTVGFLVNEMGLKGALFSTISLLPQNIIIIPSYIIISVSAISFSILLLKSKNSIEKFNFPQQITGYTALVSIMFFIISIGCFIEAFINPVFIKYMLPYI